MNIQADMVAKVLFLNGGKLIGKTRFQKTIYFLEEAGRGFGFDFEYYHYGPYSEELSSLMSDAEALKLCAIEWASTKSGAKFAIFNSNKNDFPSDAQDSNRTKILNILKEYDSVTLELAATADFLHKYESSKNKWEETARRKPDKVNPERIMKAKNLLKELQM
jgi:uncharacterized protein YwgA